MKTFILKLVALSIISLSISGCGSEQAAIFLGGVAAGLKTAEEIEANVNAELEKMEAKAAKVSNIRALVDSISEKYDPNELALLESDIKNLLMIDVNSPDLAPLIDDAVAAYHKANGTIAKIKERAKQPPVWIAVALALVAAYQKKKRIEEKK